MKNIDEVKKILEYYSVEYKEVKQNKNSYLEIINFNKNTFNKRLDDKPLFYHLIFNMEFFNSSKQLNNILADSFLYNKKEDYSIKDDFGNNILLKLIEYSKYNFSLNEDVFTKILINSDLKIKNIYEKTFFEMALENSFKFTKNDIDYLLTLDIEQQIYNNKSILEHLIILDQNLEDEKESIFINIDSNLETIVEKTKNAQSLSYILNYDLDNELAQKILNKIIDNKIFDDFIYENNIINLVDLCFENYTLCLTSDQEISLLESGNKKIVNLLFKDFDLEDSTYNYIVKNLDKKINDISLGEFFLNNLNDNEYEYIFSKEERINSIIQFIKNKPFAINENFLTLLDDNNNNIFLKKIDFMKQNISGEFLFNKLFDSLYNRQIYFILENKLINFNVKNDYGDIIENLIKDNKKIDNKIKNIIENIYKINVFEYDNIQNIYNQTIFEKFISLFKKKNNKQTKNNIIKQEKENNILELIDNDKFLLEYYNLFNEIKSSLLMLDLNNEEKEKINSFIQTNNKLIKTYKNYINDDDVIRLCKNNMDQIISSLEEIKNSYKNKELSGLEIMRKTMLK